MINLKDFKHAADEAMSNINVSDELKKKTLLRCTAKKHFYINKQLLSAACIVIVVGIVSISGILNYKSLTGVPHNHQAEPFISPGRNTAGNPESAHSDASPLHGTFETKMLKTLKEAAEVFGDKFFTPSYVPERFRLDTIFAFGLKDASADRIILNFISENQSFSIVQEKALWENAFTGNKQVDINGFIGYISSEKAPGADKESSTTEVYWYNEEVIYRVVGMITESEAIKIARSLEKK